MHSPLSFHYKCIVIHSTVSHLVRVKEQINLYKSMGCLSYNFINLRPPPYATTYTVHITLQVQKTQFEKQIFEPGVQPMEFVSMDLIGEFHPPSSKGNKYALTAVCMLTGYTFCIPIKSKSAEEIATTWRNHIAFLFGVCRKILTDNGTEFKNDLFPGLQNK